MDKYADLRYDLAMNDKFPFDAGIEKRIMDAVPALLAERDELRAALFDCVAVMQNELDGLAVIQPELRKARVALDQ